MFGLEAGPSIPDSRFHALPGRALLARVFDGKATHRPRMKNFRRRRTFIAEAIRSHAMPPFRRGDFRFMVDDGSVTSPTFKNFLSRLMVAAATPVVVIVDSHPIHESRFARALAL